MSKYLYDTLILINRLNLPESVNNYIKEFIFINKKKYNQKIILEAFNNIYSEQYICYNSSGAYSHWCFMFNYIGAFEHQAVNCIICGEYIQTTLGSKQSSETFALLKKKYIFYNTTYGVNVYMNHTDMISNNIRCHCEINENWI
jgi:hypothetical protein